MLRKFITLVLFTTSVSIAVFGEGALGAENIRAVLTGMTHRAYDHWPEAQKQIQKSLPDTAQDLAKRFNDFRPSAGMPTNMCVGINQNPAPDDEKYPS